MKDRRRAPKRTFLQLEQLDERIVPTAVHIVEPHQAVVVHVATKNTPTTVHGVSKIREVPTLTPTRSHVTATHPAATKPTATATPTTTTRIPIVTTTTTATTSTGGAISGTGTGTIFAGSPISDPSQLFAGSPTAAPSQLFAGSPTSAPSQLFAGSPTSTTGLGGTSTGTLTTTGSIFGGVPTSVSPVLVP